MANILKSGKLPAPARIIEEAIVGPSLGEEAISSGLTSFIFALLIVLVYMIFFYNRAGIVSNVASDQESNFSLPFLLGSINNITAAIIAIIVSSIFGT